MLPQLKLNASHTASHAEIHYKDLQSIPKAGLIRSVPSRQVAPPKSTKHRSKPISLSKCLASAGDFV